MLLAKYNIPYYRELVVPLFQAKVNESCTAILDLVTLHWTELPQKGPFIDKLRIFYLISDDKRENIFLLGGGQLPYSGASYLNIEDMRPSFDIQILDKTSGWRKLPGSNVTLPISKQPAFIPLDFYRNNNLPRLDFNNMKPNSKFVESSTFKEQ